MYTVQDSLISYLSLHVIAWKLGPVVKTLVNKLTVMKQCGLVVFFLGATKRENVNNNIRDAAYPKVKIQQHICPKNVIPSIPPPRIIHLMRFGGWERGGGGWTSIQIYIFDMNTQIIDTQVAPSVPPHPIISNVKHEIPPPPSSSLPHPSPPLLLLLSITSFKQTKKYI